MPSFNNYTFTNIQYTIPEGINVSVLYPTAQITIVPNSGYTAVAADFSLDPSFSDNAVQSVVFTQDGLNVLCTVTFNIGFVMPSGNYTIPLCVVGESKVSLITIGGTFIANVGPNISGDVNESVPYANSGNVGELELLFTKNYTANPGYYLTSTGLQVVTGNASNYNIVQGPTYDGNNNLIGISYAVNYLYPNQSIDGDVLRINQVLAKEIYVAPPAPVVTGYSPLPVTVSPYGETIVNWRIFGDVGAMFTVIMTDTLGNSTTLVDNGALRTCCGDYYVQVVIPSIIGAANEEIYTITLSGDIDPNFAQENPATINQTTVSPKIEFTGTSTNGITGYTPVITERAALTRLVEDSNLITIEWDISTPNGLLQYTNTTSSVTVTSMDQAAQSTNTSVVSNSTSLDLDSTTNITAGDKFNLPTTAFSNSINSAFAPFEYEVISVNSATNITISPAISMLADNLITFWNNNGNVSTIESSSYVPVTDSSGKLTLVFDVTGYGNADSTFIVDLDTIFNFIPNLACGSTAISGGEGVTDYSLALDPAGGLVAFLINGQGLPDKFEIFHGLPFANDKKATSSMVASGNFGPFENNFGTSPLNQIPTTSQLNPDQFIGSDKGTIPSRTAEFLLDTGFTIPNMTVGGTTYQQVVWWQYTAADYTKDPNATIRITGPSGTGWDALRLCCPDGNCT